MHEVDGWKGKWGDNRRVERVDGNEEEGRWGELMGRGVNGKGTGERHVGRGGIERGRGDRR